MLLNGRPAKYAATSSSSAPKSHSATELNKPRLRTITEILRDHEGDVSTQPTQFIGSPVIFCIRQNRSLAAVIGTSVEDQKVAFEKMKAVSMRTTDATQTPNPNNETSFGKIDESWQSEAEAKEFLEKRYVAIENINLNTLSQNDSVTLWAGLAFLADEQQFKGAHLNPQVDLFIAKNPKIDGILKLAEMYHAIQRNHVTGDFYAELKNSVALLSKHNATTDVTNELATLDRYIWKRDMGTANADIKKDDLVVKEFDVAAFKVIEAARALKLKLAAEQLAEVKL